MRFRATRQKLTGVVSDRSLLLAIAMLRTDEALEYLLTLLAEGMTAEAIDAVEALATCRHDPRLAGRVRQIVEDKKNRTLARAMNKAFGAPGAG